MGSINVVVLEPEEQGLYDSINWEPGTRHDEDEFDQLHRMGMLAEMLIFRDAIPAQRWRYFADARLNAGYGKSRQENFKENGCSTADILRHPNFRKYLWYFINGPKLPISTVEGFCRIVKEDRGTSGMVLEQIKKFVRQEMRDRALDRSESSDEFFKLAVEIDRIDLAELVRLAAKSGR